MSKLIESPFTHSLLHSPIQFLVGVKSMFRAPLTSGMATEELQPTEFTITASNSAGLATMVVTLTIAK